MAKTRKVVLFVVEGPTDETALGQAFERTFAAESVMFDVVHGDLTTQTSPKRARERVRDRVMRHIDHVHAYAWRDLEHALHGIGRECSDAEKARLARAFRSRYGTRPDDFRRFLESEDVSVAGSYVETWRYIQEGTNSLKRGSNLRLVLPNGESK